MLVPQTKSGAKLKTDDSMEDVLHVMSHDSILFFTDDGIARGLKAYQIPEAARTAIGSAITQVCVSGLFESVRHWLFVAMLEF